MAAVPFMILFELALKSIFFKSGSKKLKLIWEKLMVHLLNLFSVYLYFVLIRHIIFV